MYKKCMSEISILRQQEIEDAFLEALMRDGYEQINISRICENLNIPRKSFYRYFRTPMRFLRRVSRLRSYWLNNFRKGR